MERDEYWTLSSFVFLSAPLSIMNGSERAHTTTLSTEKTQNGESQRKIWPRLCDTRQQKDRRSPQYLLFLSGRQATVNQKGLFQKCGTKRNLAQHVSFFHLFIKMVLADDEHTRDKSWLWETRLFHSFRNVDMSKTDEAFEHVRGPLVREWRHNSSWEFRRRKHGDVRSGTYSIPAKLVAANIPLSRIRTKGCFLKRLAYSLTHYLMFPKVCKFKLQARRRRKLDFIRTLNVCEKG